MQCHRCDSKFDKIWCDDTQWILLVIFSSLESKTRKKIKDNNNNPDEATTAPDLAPIAAVDTKLE